MPSSEKKKQRNKPLLLAGIGIAVLLIISSILMHIIANTTVRNIIYDNRIGIIQRDKMLYASEVDGWFLSTYSMVNVLDDILTALSYPQEYSGPGFRDYCHRDQEFRHIAEQIVREHEHITNVFIGFADGSIINGAGIRPGPGWSARNAAWFAPAVEAGEGNIIVVNPYWSYGNQNFTAAIATWLPQLNNVGAVVGVSIAKDNILYKITHDAVFGDGYRVLVTPEGEIIYHSLFPHGGTNQMLSDIPNGDVLLECIRMGSSPKTFDDPFLGYSYFFAAQLETVGWTLFDVVPASAVGDAIGQNLFAIMIPMGVLLVAMYVCAFILFYAITRYKEEQLSLERNLATSHSRAKSKFLTYMSHEIRTPISLVVGIAEIQYCHPEHSQEAKNAFLQIYNTSNALTDILNSILDLSQIEAGKMKIINKEINIPLLIEDITQVHALSLENKNFKFTINIDENIPCTLYGDELRIKQVINNLLFNSFKYTEAGEVGLKMEVKPSKQDDFVDIVIIISDTGCGMTSRQVDILLKEDYARFDEENHPEIRGTGLGISIVQRLLALMGASMEIESKPNEGTTVSVTIPLKLVNKDILGVEVANQLEALEAVTTNYIDFKHTSMPWARVLVVDDMEANLFVIGGLLKLYDLQVEKCTSAKIAIEKVESGETYDIIFMDHMMPDMNGIEAIKILRAMGYKNAVIALSANAFASQQEEFLQNNFDGFIAKPIKTAILRDTLLRYIKPKDPSQAIEPSYSTDDDTNNTEDFYESPAVKKMVRDYFISSKPTILTELNEALQNNDLWQVRLIAHSIKNKALMIKEETLGNAAEVIEEAAKDNNLPSADMLYALEAELGSMFDKISNNEAN